MKISDFDYELPDELIAQNAIEPRSASRLLHIEKTTGEVHHCQFLDCLDLLEAGDLLVLNETRVTARRVFGQKSTGGQIELLILRQVSESEVLALSKPAKRLKACTRIRLDSGEEAEVTEEREGGIRQIRFLESQNLSTTLSQLGQIPLPPYIHTLLEDEERYQTTYSSIGGSAAAPTAGLHFTPELLEQLNKKGVNFTKVSLDVGLDTFRPITAETTLAHEMHGETCRISSKTVEDIHNCAGRVIAVGTTSVRTIESFSKGHRQLSEGEMSTHLFITPGYKWQTIDGMFTNFHMPRTTMLLMLAAMCGKDALMSAYDQAVNKRYRFLSLGDSMLIL